MKNTAFLALSLLPAALVACGDESSSGTSDTTETSTSSMTATATSTGTSAGTTDTSAGSSVTNSVTGTATTGSPTTTASSSATGTGGASTTGTATGDTTGTGGLPSTTGGGAGGSGGGSNAGICPSGSESMAPVLTGSPTQVSAVPPSDGYEPFNIEGPVWVGGALYMSEIKSGENPPPARILKYTPGGAVEVWKDDVGTNGLAIDASGALYGASHKDGSISRFDLGNAAAAPVPLVNMYMGARFSSPNDLTISSTGIIYFTDPDWQASMPAPQPQRAYWFDSNDTATINVIPDTTAQPNGITLSPDEQTLYVAGQGRVMAYALSAGGAPENGAPFGPESLQGVDGMAVDCAGNLYAAVNGVGDIAVISPAGTELGRITVGSGVTNVAFGGADRTQLYVTKMNQPGLWEVDVGIAGYPY